MKNFATYFDINYLPQGIILYNSLKNTCKDDFNFYVLCLDNLVYDFFKSKNSQYSNIFLIKLDELENNDTCLKNIKNSRKKIEYYFTLSPCLPLYILKRYKIDHICTLDADIKFFSSPDIIFDKLNDYSIIITPHKFSKNIIFLEKYGLFNVSFQIFKNNQIGLNILNEWRLDCINWCKDEYDSLNERFADQKYLDKWPDKYSNDIFILNDNISGLAIWNLNNYDIRLDNLNNLLSNNSKVIFYHFHNFKLFNNFIAFNGFTNYKVFKNKMQINYIYQNYWTEIMSIIRIHNLNISKNARYNNLQNIFKLFFNQKSFFFKLNTKLPLLDISLNYKKNE